MTLDHEHDVLITDRNIYDPEAEVYYTPMVCADGRVGYRVGRTDGRPDAETFIYFNPSRTDGPNDTPNVFLYIGENNDPAYDEPQHFYNLGPEAFGLDREDEA